MISEKVFAKLDQLEGPFCRRAAMFHKRPIGNLFKLVSWLGNGPAWGVLIAFFLYYEPMFGITLLAVTLTNLVLYKTLKAKTVRRRPFKAGNFDQGARALDEFSFPSGHTLHAVSITALCLVVFPAVGLALVPLAVLIAMSRVVLGLHYPSDVLVGTGLGLLTASIALV